METCKLDVLITQINKPYLLTYMTYCMVSAQIVLATAVTCSLSGEIIRVLL